MPTYKTSKSREAILNRIRKSLSEHQAAMPFPEAEKEPHELIYAATDISDEERFAMEFTRLGGKFVFCADERDFVENLVALTDSRGWTQVLCAEASMHLLLQDAKLDFVAPSDPQNATADACITGCEVLVARTGSIFFSSKQHDGRVAPVFYPVHIIVAYADQFVPDIQHGLHSIHDKYTGSLPSMINLNTGPSRTADIEKTLVVGVHGPGEVFLFYINQPYDGHSKPGRH